MNRFHQNESDLGMREKEHLGGCVLFEFFQTLKNSDVVLGRNLWTCSILGQWEAVFGPISFMMYRQTHSYTQITDLNKCCKKKKSSNVPNLPKSTTGTTMIYHSYFFFVKLHNALRGINKKQCGVYCIFSQHEVTPCVAKSKLSIVSRILYNKIFISYQPRPVFIPN